MRAVNHYLMSPPARLSWLCQSRQYILQMKSHANLDRPGKLEIGKEKPPTAVKTRSFATCIMRRNHSYSHREREGEQTTTNTVSIQSSGDEAATGGGGVTHTRVQSRRFTSHSPIGMTGWGGTWRSESDG